MLHRQGPRRVVFDGSFAFAIAAGATLAFGCDAGPAAGDLYPVDDVTTLASTSTGGVTGPPKVIYLVYSTGGALTSTAPDPCHATAPKFVCQFASTLKECQRQVQSYLDAWYADFNVVFTLTRPTSGAYYTEVVSSGGGAWCGADTTTAGIAPFYCQDLTAGMAYAFLGGASAKETAIIIAQEQAHLVGLEHTKSERDVMHPTVCTGCDGFENVDNPVDTDHCGRPTQNSYQMMKDRLGAWPGGVKPSPFGCDPDVTAPSIAIVQPADGATVGSSFQLAAQASDDCEIKQVSVRIDPLGLSTQSTAPPFTWNLSRISGRQTITVTAADTSGKLSSASITVNAPGAGSSGGSDAGNDGGPTEGGTGGQGADDASTMTAQSPDTGLAGCQVGGCATAASSRPGGGDEPATDVTAGVGFAMVAGLLARRSGRRARDRRRPGAPAPGA